MRICVLTDEVPEDFEPAPYMEGFDWEMITMTDPVMDVLRALDARDEFDVYINICEGYEPGEDWEYQGIDVVSALEELNLPYTGAIPLSSIRHARKCRRRRMLMELILQRGIV